MLEQSSVNSNQNSVPGIDKKFVIIVLVLIVLIGGISAYIYFFTVKPEGGVINDIKSFLSNNTSVESTQQNNQYSKNYLNEVNKVRLLWGGGKYSESLTQANELLTKATTDKEEAVARYWIGLSYYNLGNIDQSESEELLAIRLDPKFEGPYVTLAAISLGKNDCKKALDFSLKAVELAPKWAWGHNDLGLSYLCLGDKEQGVAELKKAIELDPESYVFQNNLRRVIEQNN